MKYIFLNDRTEDLIIHPQSLTTGVAMRPGSMIEIAIPDNTIPFIKVWDHQVLLSCKVINKHLGSDFHEELIKENVRLSKENSNLCQIVAPMDTALGNMRRLERFLKEDIDTLKAKLKTATEALELCADESYPENWKRECMHRRKVANAALEKINEGR